MEDHSEWGTRAPTLGEQLDVQARTAVARLLPSLPWAGPLRLLVEHLGSLRPSDGRFDRVESAPGNAVLRLAPVLPARRTLPLASPGPGAAPHPQGTARAAGAGDAAGVPEGRPLAADVRSRLGDVAGRAAAAALRVHDDDAADALARAHRADAVTVGRDVHFRRGRYQPRNDRGFGLLVHEATHVLALLRPGADWYRATRGGVRDEEAHARDAERAGLPGRPPGPRGHARADARPARPGGRTPSLPDAPAAVPAAPAMRPMPAVEQRGTESSGPAPLDLEAVRRGLIDELMRRLRTEFERGA